MKAPAFAKTIGFKLAIWYTALLILFAILLIASINLAMVQARRDIPRWFVVGNHTPAEVAIIVGEKYTDHLRLYSLISFGGVVVLGGIGGYFLSKKMLTPVDKVTTLASSISTTNLKERINYQGPDDEVKRLADTFDDMLDRLENAFESQNQFIQDASHELRTPIAIARTNIEVLEMENKPSAKDYKRLVEVLKLSIDRMSRLIDKLLLLSKDKQRATEPSVVDISSILDEVITEFNAKAINSGVNLKLEPATGKLFVRGDSLSLKQAISNIIDNAIRYNRSGGQVNVSTWVDNGQLIIQVQDSGIGISEADQKRIFNRFYRVDKSRSRAQGGSGLGLAIVKEIVESHGGTIEVESIPGKGSTFRIILPLHD
jgi:signal transduction histidine kinase